MKFLLYLKPWVLFLIFIASILLASDSSYGLFIGFACWIIYAGWIYQIGVTMHNYTSLQNKPSIRYFQFSCCLMPFMIMSTQIFYLYLEAFITVNETLSTIISIAISCYMCWTWLYICMFAARMLESVIEGELVNKSDSLKGFVCLLFFPFGVWYIQPAVQRVLIKYKDSRYSLKG